MRKQNMHELFMGHSVILYTWLRYLIIKSIHVDVALDYQCGEHHRLLLLVNNHNVILYITRQTVAASFAITLFS